jgi:hypothetical protein
MKRNLVLMGCAAMLIAMAGVVFAGEQIRVNVPFEFYVGNQLLPAGEYKIEMGALGTDAASSVVIREESGAGVAFVLTRPVSNRNTTPAQLRFNQYGTSKHFLASVSAYNCTAGLTMTKAEKEMSQYGSKASTILLAQGK